MAKTISLEYEGQKYTLEYTVGTAKRMEDEGFEPSAMDDIGKKPVSVILALVTAAFYEHHPEVTADKAVEIYSHQKKKGDLLGHLGAMYQDCISVFFDEEDEDDEKNVGWSVVE